MREKRSTKMKKGKSRNKRKDIDRGKKKKKQKDCTIIDTKASYLIRDNSAIPCAHMRKVQCAARVYLELKRTLNCVHFNHPRTLNHTAERFNFTWKHEKIVTPIAESRDYCPVSRGKKTKKKKNMREETEPRNQGAAERKQGGQWWWWTERRSDDGETERERDGEVRKRNTQERVRSFVGPYSRIGYGEDKETQLRITLRWRLMGGNKKGHRVATAAPIYGGEREEFPSTRDTVLRGGEMRPPPRAAPTTSPPKTTQARCASSALGDLRVASRLDRDVPEIRAVL